MASCDYPSFNFAESEQAANHSDKNVPVARIPWIPLETGARLQTGVLDLEKSNYFKEMVANKTNLQLFQLMNQVFPFYLPKRYHTMDGWSLHKSSSDGQYWANASHFLMANQAHEQIYFYNLFEELKKSSPDLSKFDPVFPPKSREFLLKDGLELCSSAAEFLLEPWILIQLPFQPILLHQWAAALMAETLKFQKEICDFYCMIIIPKSFRAMLKQICSMCDKMLMTAFTMMNCVLSFFKNGHCNLRISVVPCLNYLWKDMTELIPILEFVLSDECRNIVKALKRMCWNSPTTPREGILNEKSYGCLQVIDAFNIMYNYEFWKSETTVQPSYFVETTIEEGWFDKRLKEEYDLNHKNKDMLSSDWDVIMKIINTLITLGGNRGDQRETILKAAILQSHDLKYLYFLYKTFSETSSAIKVVDDANAGVLYNLISLYSDLRVAEATAKLAARMAPTFYKTYANALDGCKSPSPNARYIQKKLSKVLVPNNKWKYQNILAQVKETCFSPSRTKEPNLKQGAKKIAEHFQERIKNLVFKMIEAQSKTINGPFTYYPECQVVQYLLPCFVASFLDLHEDPSASTKEKENYLAFVHKIVKSYEDKEFCQKLSVVSRKLSFTSGVQASCMMANKFVYWQKNVINHLANVSSKKAIHQFCEKGLRLLCNCSPKPYPSLCCPPMVEFNPWTMQLYMVLCRINSTFGKLILLSDAPFHSFSFMYGMNAIQIFHKEGRRPSMCEKFLMLKLKIIVDQVSTSHFMVVSEENFPTPKAMFSKLADFKKITCVQLFGIVMFQYMASLDADHLKKVESEFVQGPGFPLDSLDAVFWSILCQDHWKVMQHLCTFLDSDLFRDTSYLAPFTFAKSNSFYDPVLELISSEGKIKMSHPGEITFFPIKHCRWCGLVDAKEFRTCPECLDNPEYLDVNYFCSEKCEKDCLEKQHTEEHARFLMIKCDIDV